MFPHTTLAKIKNVSYKYLAVFAKKLCKISIFPKCTLYVKLPRYQQEYIAHHLDISNQVMCLYICQWRIQHRAYPAYAPPPPYWLKYCIFLNKVKLIIFFQPKCGLRPLLLHILDPPLYVAAIPKGGGLVPAWKVRDRRFVSCFGNPSFKEQNVSSLLNREDCILWAAYMTER